MSKVDKDRIYTSKELHAELNAERKRHGLGEMPVINPRGGGPGIIARKDKSWGNVLEFFVKQFKKEK